MALYTAGKIIIVSIWRYLILFIQFVLLLAIVIRLSQINLSHQLSIKFSNRFLIPSLS